MPRGRKPQPTYLKIARGNPGLRPLPKGEPQPDPSLPDVPTHLGPVARDEWQRLAPDLHRIGVLTQADRAALAIYCQLYQQWVYAEEHIQRNLLITEKHTGRLAQNPLLRISHRTLDLMRGYMAELGLTPASRVRLAKGETPQADPLEDFLQGKKKTK